MAEDMDTASAIFARPFQFEHGRIQSEGISNISRRDPNSRALFLAVDLGGYQETPLCDGDLLPQPVPGMNLRGMGCRLRMGMH
jgi:hypothetical protein